MEVGDWLKRVKKENEFFAYLPIISYHVELQ
jgi:hypothetical protein